MPGKSDLVKAAQLSKDGVYRYSLSRQWGPGPAMPFVMLNPSTADSLVDDPTIGRCMEFARREGKDGIVVCNVYAFRATKPAVLFKAQYPFGAENDAYLADLAANAAAYVQPVVCAWGAKGRPDDVAHTRRLLAYHGAKLVCLGTTKDGHPKHPLYVAGATPLVPYA